jgi:hypothetical protein
MSAKLAPGKFITAVDVWLTPKASGGGRCDRSDGASAKGQMLPFAVDFRVRERLERAAVSMEAEMQNVVALLIVVVACLALPVAILRMHRFARKSRRTKAIGAGIDAGFAVFDPSRARARQIIEIRKEIGQADEGGQDEPFGPR